MIEKIEKIFNEEFKSLGYDITCKIISSKEKNADFQCDDLFKLAKIYHKAPITIGTEVVEKLKKHKKIFKTIECVKPGFINISVTDEFINENLRQLIKDKKLKVKPSKSTIVLDYGGPNVAKPLHVGHLRTAIIGQSINNILKFTGNKTISDVHLGDIGTQMGQVIFGILSDFPKQKAEDIQITLDYLNKTYPKISALCKENDEVRNKCLEITKELQNGNKKYKALWEKIYEISVKDIKRLYDYLDVKFDYWYGESDAYKEFEELFKFLNEKKVIEEDNGAKIINVKEESDKINIPPCIVQKSDGAYLYASSDLGTIWQRKRDFTPDNIIYITDARQSLHFTQIFRVVSKTSMYKGKLEFCGYGTVNGKDGKPFKTRSGGSFKLDDLISSVKEEFKNLRKENQKMDEKDLDIIVNAIIKYADLQNDLTRNYIFDIKKFSEVNGKTGPYILYTYLRINKLLSSNNGILSDKIYNETDRKLRLKILEVSSIINQSSKNRKPHYIASYLYDLSVLANNFYETNKMNNIEEDIRNDYDIVLTINNYILKTLLNLLGINIPKKM